jgi:protoporphyrinogen oxidase
LVFGGFLQNKTIAILGGGIAGLAAAMYLSRNNYIVHVFEKEEDVGGLASGRIINNNIYEYGPHFFHTNDPKILDEIKNITGDELKKFERTILIKFMDNYFTYPISIFEIFKKLPRHVVLAAISSLLKNNIVRIFKKPEVENSETVLLGFQGKILYELFFKNYIYHVWGIYPSEFSPEFAKERIPKISASTFINKIMASLRVRLGSKSTEKFVENVDGQLFTTAKGYRGIVEKMAEVIKNNGGKIHLKSEVIKINLKDNLVEEITIKSDKKYDFKCDGIISTIPINESVMVVSEDISPSIKESANALEFRALVFVGVLVNKPKVLPVSFMYFREHSFNRVYDSSYFSHDTVIPNTTILVAEISCSTADIYWTDDEYCKGKVIKDLLRENIIKEQDILEINVYRYKCGYPIYKLGYEKHLNNLLEYIKNFKNFKTTGRQGLFQYINGHIAIKMGFDAAQNIIHSI